jgi:hypothetical protein
MSLPQQFVSEQEEGEDGRKLEDSFASIRTGQHLTKRQGTHEG